MYFSKIYIKIGFHKQKQFLFKKLNEIRDNRLLKYIFIYSFLKNKNKAFQIKVGWLCDAAYQPL